MCVDDDSFPPISGGAAGSRDFHLTSSDGTRFMAHAARAARPTGAGMVVIPDVRGTPPGDIPIEVDNRIYLAVNLKVARAIGLRVPPEMFVRANRVIE